jgi:Tfp pilus assembly protein PilF
LELGEALLQAGLLDDAATELNAAVAAEPENARAVVALARAYELRKDVAAAGRTLELAVSHGVHAAPVYAELAEVYEASGHVANAIPAMRLAIDADPKNEAYRFRYGMMLCDTKAPAAAAIRLKEALQEFPSSPRLWFALGIAYFSDNKTEDAAGAFSKAVQLDDKFAPAYAYLGMSQVDSGRYSEAVKLYDKALALRESFPAAHYLRAEALLKLEPPDEVSAERDLARAVALQPSLMQAHLELGKIYLHTGRTQQGVAELEGVVKDAPDIAEAHYQLGRAYQKLARRDDAQAQFSSFERLQKEQREQTIAERQRLLKQLADVRF